MKTILGLLLISSFVALAGSAGATIYDNLPYANSVYSFGQASGTGYVQVFPLGGDSDSSVGARIDSIRIAAKLPLTGASPTYLTWATVETSHTCGDGSEAVIGSTTMNSAGTWGITGSTSIVVPNIIQTMAAGASNSGTSMANFVIDPTTQQKALYLAKGQKLCVMGADNALTGGGYDILTTGPSL